MTKKKQPNTLFIIFTSLAMLAVLIMVITLVLSNFKTNVYDVCCKQNNASYIMYECQCNYFNSCENLTCGAYCQFQDGHLENADKIKCSLNVTN